MGASTRLSVYLHGRPSLRGYLMSYRTKIMSCRSAQRHRDGERRRT
ncbi:hypothetical protein HMPREF1979_01897 [Actinomyces johnsonii F0542]|uniref:Uncharacterized protein n=1 Tax=Actinomyces johnsonii F0542 TaxID=1321818 RepID=U1RUD1_9ACTO|nr:hypothetical protein HMPREF1979_01897 [Actinomyces johnsonii F0542]